MQQCSMLSINKIYLINVLNFNTLLFSYAVIVTKYSPLKPNDYHVLIQTFQRVQNSNNKLLFSLNLHSIRDGCVKSSGGLNLFV